MKRILSMLLIVILTGSITTSSVMAQKEPPKKLENPFSEAYIKSKMSKSSPRLILTPAIERNLKSRLKTDPVVKNYYAAMRVAAGDMLRKPTLTYNVVGRRLLGTSREMLLRMTVLSMVYRIEKEPAILNKIDAELRAVCNFPDWHPSHFLDVAEMALAVAIAVDWTGSWLPAETVTLARKSLIEKGINASFVKGSSGWVSGTNNWNQVCNGGMIAAAIVIGDKDPSLAARVISRSLDGMPAALVQYAPSGIYPEGATYWSYGTSFSCVTASALKSAFGQDYGIAAYPSFLESANFKLLSAAPSGWYFNFADCGDREDVSGDIVLAWFAKETGNSLYYQKDRFMKPLAERSNLSRLAGAGLVWLSEFTPSKAETLPPAWMGDGANPLVIFRGGDNDPVNYYFGGKGGRGNLSHGNLDAGSFVFELNGVRWSVDPGNQDYNVLEQAGFDLWNQTQNSPRWTLLTKGNQGHSTLTVNDARYIVNATAPVIDFKPGNNPEATVDMTPVFGGNLKSAQRKFIKDTGHSIVIEDHLVLNDSTRNITWAMMTTAEVLPTDNGAVLRQDGKELNLIITSPGKVKVSTIMMDPAPMKLDRQIPGLKRIEIRIPDYIFEEGKGTIRVRLTSL
jgi:hypothetical protein